MVRASVRAIINSLTLVDYLPVQTHKPYSNYRLLEAIRSMKLPRGLTLRPLNFKSHVAGSNPAGSEIL